MDFIWLPLIALLPLAWTDIMQGRFETVNCYNNSQYLPTLSDSPVDDNFAPSSLTECVAACLVRLNCSAVHFNDEARSCTTLVGPYACPASPASVLYRKIVGCGLLDGPYVESNCVTPLVAPLPDTALSATSSWGTVLAPECAKLYDASSSCTDAAGSWSPSITTDAADYLQINFLELRTITQYAMKARIAYDGCQQWVTSFYLSYSCDGRQFTTYSNNGIPNLFLGNSDSSTIVKFTLPKPIVGVRFLRIQPYQYYEFKSLRVEIYGC